MRDKNYELKISKKLINDVKYIVLNAREYDKIMAKMLSFTRFINFLFLLFLTKDINELEKFSSLTFRAQLMVARALMNEQPELFVGLQARNKEFIEMLDKIESKFNNLLNLIRSSEENSYKRKFLSVKKKIRKTEESYNKLYDLFTQF